MSNHDPYSDSPSPLVGFSTTKVYSGIGADIVMESVTLKTPFWIPRKPDSDHPCTRKRGREHFAVGIHKPRASLTAFSSGL
jgi:hypothetical protein